MRLQQGKYRIERRLLGFDAPERTEQIALAAEALGPNRLSWGILIQTGQSHALRGWWLALFPGLALALTSVGLTLLALGRGELENEHGLSMAP